MTRNTKLISSYKLLGISPEVIQSYYYDVPTKNIRRVAGLGAETQGAGKYSQAPIFTRDRRHRPDLCPRRLAVKYFSTATLTAACCQLFSSATTFWCYYMMLLLNLCVTTRYMTTSLVPLKWPCDVWQKTKIHVSNTWTFWKSFFIVRRSFYDYLATVKFYIALIRQNASASMSHTTTNFISSFRELAWFYGS